jgi:hypothetical protein
MLSVKQGANKMTQASETIIMVHALKAANPDLSLQERSVLARSIVRFLKRNGYEIVRKAQAHA